MSAEKWWHGGPHVRGNWILPPAETGKCRSGNDGEHQDKVFITPIKTLALMYAASCDGWLYEVEPQGDILNDPDSVIYTSRSFMCSRAKIMRRIKPTTTEVKQYGAAVRAAAQMLTPHEQREGQGYHRSHEQAG